MKKTENGFDATFKIASLEKAIMPTTIRLTLADGTIRDERFSEDVFTNLSTGEFVVKIYLQKLFRLKSIRTKSFRHK